MERWRAGWRVIASNADTELEITDGPHDADAAGDLTVLLVLKLAAVQLR